MRYVHWVRETLCHIRGGDLTLVLRDRIALGESWQGEFWSAKRPHSDPWYSPAVLLLFFPAARG